jgi:hypothetical protein
MLPFIGLGGPAAGKGLLGEMASTREGANGFSLFGLGGKMASFRELLHVVGSAGEGGARMCLAKRQRAQRKPPKGGGIRLTGGGFVPGGHKWLQFIRVGRRNGFVS